MGFFSRFLHLAKSFETTKSRCSHNFSHNIVLLMPAFGLDHFFSVASMNLNIAREHSRKEAKNKKSPACLLDFPMDAEQPENENNAHRCALRRRSLSRHFHHEKWMYREAWLHRRRLSALDFRIHKPTDLVELWTIQYTRGQIRLLFCSF